MELSMKELRDNQVVQGQLLHRVEMNLGRLEETFTALRRILTAGRGSSSKTPRPSLSWPTGLCCCSLP
jgi:hypothetical protein